MPWKQNKYKKNSDVQNCSKLYHRRVLFKSCSVFMFSDAVCVLITQLHTCNLLLKYDFLRLFESCSQHTGDLCGENSVRS